MMPDGDIVYLASPYTHPKKRVKLIRFRKAARAAAVLIKQGLFIFSPITHTYPMEEYGIPGDWEFWKAYDEKLLSICSRMIVLCLPGWEESVGVQAEISYMKAANKPISYVKESELY